ncbi:hypothetical protein [Dyadobacter pollutisoli]|uniref:Outer membrane protein beta-barrel domain-containing protein n=1 Tax=Dyadobacter pollutisoli TaxID=2910158 RepID=A0A9E8N933_9BACT|nr:hypothetical protein [Dyadobacter pollutisoli]WAC12220.1 hypothetical protein ON006_31410 [Dyadobacter pollutisoli]
MKTNKFENTIRRKLESIEPDFHEQDWARMQNYMHAHTPPTFWQQYSSWVGYAAAASVTTVMAFLYVNQLSKNNHLVSDVKNLQNQIEVIKNQPAPVAKTDTVYLVQKEMAPENAFSVPQIQDRLSYAESQTLENQNSTKENQDSQALSDINNGAQNSDRVTSTTLPESVANVPAENFNKNGSGKINETYPRQNPATIQSQETVELAKNEIHASSGYAGVTSGAGQKVLGTESGIYAIQNAVGMNNGYVLSRKMSYNLANRLSVRQVQRAFAPVANTQLAKATVSDKKVEKTTQTENVIPKLPLKVPYRFGGGIQIEKGGQAKTIVAEVLVSKKFSISAGISWLKVKPMEFFTEKVFREKNRKDFKQTNPGEVPLIFEIYNIKVNPTLVQIPLTVAFRNTLKDDWAYYAGVGTNIKISSKERISYDCQAPNNLFFNQTFEHKTNIPAVSSVNFSLGIEKTWHPIVVQAEGYLFTYFKPLTPFSNSAGPGVKVKLLYQIGGKKM